MEKCKEKKLLHIESSLIWYKVHLIWINRTQDIAILAHAGPIGSVCKENVFACGKWDNLRNDLNKSCW